MFSVTTFEPRTLNWWYSQRKKIDVSPSYQRRGKLWSKRDKSFLIDSILNDFDIPKLYLADFTVASTKLNEKKLPYAIIDGKQRLEAIFEFLEGRISLNDDFKYAADPSLDISGAKFSDIKAKYPEIAEKIELCHLTVMRVVTDDESRINELFIRLNRSKPLTGAEIRNAMAGPVPRMLRTLSNHAFFVEKVDFTKQRGSDLNTAAKLLAFEYYGKPVDTKRRDLDALVTKWAKRIKAAKAEGIRDRIVATLDKLTSIFLEEDPLLKSAGIVPVYYWFARDVATEHGSEVRPFLESFDRRAREAREHLKQRRQSDDVDAAAFVDASRSTNDEGSYVKRVDILQSAFAEALRRRSNKKKRKE